MHYRRWRLYGDPGHAAPRKTMQEWLRECLRDRPRGEGCWDDFPGKTRTQENGYPALMFRKRYTLVTRFVLQEEGIECPGEPFPKGEWEVLHSCDNKECFNPEHLRWGSRSENIREAYSRGLNPLGQENPECSTPGCGLRHKSHYMYEYMKRRRSAGKR